MPVRRGRCLQDETLLITPGATVMQEKPAPNDLRTWVGQAQDIKAVLALSVFLTSFTAFACEQELAGNYAIRSVNDGWMVTMQLKWQNSHLVAFTRGDTGDWELNPQQPRPFPPPAFAAFTKQPAPSNYCGILVSGVILARVPHDWSWADFTTQTGFTAISLGGPREVNRIEP